MVWLRNKKTGGLFNTDDINKKEYSFEEKKPEKIYDVDGKLSGYKLGNNYLLKKASFRGGYSNNWVINKKDKRTSFMLYKEYQRAKEEGWFIDDIKDFKDGLKKLNDIYKK